MGVGSDYGMVSKDQRFVQTSSQSACLSPGEEGVIGMHDVRGMTGEDVVEEGRAEGDRERVHGAGRTGKRAQTVNVRFRVLIAVVGGRVDVDVVALASEFARERRHRYHDSVDDRMVALGEKGDAHRGSPQ